MSSLASTLPSSIRPCWTAGHLNRAYSSSTESALGNRAQRLCLRNVNLELVVHCDAIHVACAFRGDPALRHVPPNLVGLAFRRRSVPSTAARDRDDPLSILQLGDRQRR